MRLRKMDNNKRVNADPSSDSPRSESKLGEEKRKFPGSEDIAGENIDHGQDSKRIKMRDIESILQSQGSGTHCPDKTSISKNAKNQSQSSRKEEVVVVPKTKEIPKFIDLTTEEPENPSPKNVPLRVDGSSSSNKQTKDLNIGSQVGNVSKVVPKNPLQPSIFVRNQLKPREDSECGSSTGPVEENESLRRWKEMKQNGFLSSTSTTAPVAVPPPKRRVTKTNNIKEIKSTNAKSVNMKTTNVKSVSMRTTKCTKSSDANHAMKKRMEIAKKEEINRFTKVAAPSGLLNGLNPGIITHVRNSKQVHSIIEALVRSEKIQNSRKTTGAELMRETKDGNNHTDSLANFQDLGVPSFSLSVEDELAHTFNGSSKDAIYVAYKKVCSDTSGASYLTSGSEDDIFAVKLSPSMPPEYSSPNIEESASKTSISSLSIKAATVASQWLELLYQDFRGRLAAIERSKKRLQSVIQIELPLLVSREFPNEQENSIICSQSSSTNEHHYARVKDIHRSRWSAVFDQMEKQLYEEGKQLERWLNQVKEMQLHCEWGLQCVNWHDFQLQKPEDDSRLKKGSKLDKELSVMAAAASIYSTCNLVMAKGNVFCR